MIKLPAPRTQGSMSVETALSRRRSERSFSSASLELDQVSQLLWSAYGITNSQGYRTAPSAKALFPLEIDLVTGSVTGLAAGTYRYRASSHALELRLHGDKRRALALTTYDQAWIENAAVIVVFSAVYEKARAEFGESAQDFVHMDLGHAGQNLHLQAEALNLGTVVVAAFRRLQAAEVLSLPDAIETPLYLMPIGYPLRTV